MDPIFIEVDVQVDFIDPAGTLYVPGSQEIAPNIRRLLEFATQRGITTISPMCAHVVNDAEFQQFPPHCIEGTPGQRRFFDDLPKLPRHIWPADTAPKPAELTIEPGHHYVAAKRSFPMFTNPGLQALRARGVFRDADCVVFGVATDVCVRIDTLDLCRAGAHVRLVTDAIAGITPADTDRALQEMLDAGARFVHTADVVG
ncbi:MAG TPA: isochorismatase family cysteine hydrolase [Candidatus Margulisiibacteriota bacterium]|nr:isochorismatase family cysteine hydrolase [Candidatus Margulisiibacteriota bacterium]